jgi:hypothetical protein
MGRSCYTVMMQFDEAGLVVAPVTYFFAGDDATPLPFHTPFAPRNVWAPNGWLSLPPGEQVDSDTPWSNGEMPGFFPGNGSFCGPRDWWENGVPSDAPPLDYGTSGVPPCCPQQPCQPWRVFVPTGTTFVRLLNGESWLQFTNTSGQWRARGITFPTDSVNAVNDHVHPCSGFDGTILQMHVVTSTVNQILPMTLQSFDPTTLTGIWKVDPAQFRYANELFAFHRRVT